MSCRITLPFWPAAFNCLSWSKDNWLAVGGGESVAILSPCLQVPDRSGSYWSTVVIKVKAFTAAEVPLQDPLSFANFSVGEEQSQRLVQDLSWSPPGLAQFGRSALAVLSSNHVLSLYECSGKPDDPSRWGRKLIINHAVQEYYRNADGVRLDVRGVSGGESEKVCQRIRAFAWSPKIFDDQDDADGVLPPYLQHGACLLAVSTEAGDLLFLTVESLSGSDPLSDDMEWKVTVIAAVDCEARLREACSEVDAVRTEENEFYQINRGLVADDLLWRSNTVHNGQGYAHLVFTVMGRLFVAKLRIFDVYATFNDASNDTVTPLLPQVKDFGSTMCVAPNGGEVVAFAAQSVFVFGSTGTEALSEHHLDDRWDPITGAALTSGPDGKTQMHFTSHLSTTSTKTCTLKLPFCTELGLTTSSWRHAIDESKAIFSADHDLGGNVQESTWGIAASPLGDYVATCVTMHPSDAVSYEPGNRQSCIVNITFEAEPSPGASMPQSGTGFLSHDVPADTVFFSLQQHIRRMQDSEKVPSSQEDFIKTLEDNVKGILGREVLYEGDASNALLPGAIDPEVQGVSEATKRLKHYICFSPPVLQCRLRRLVRVALSGCEAAGVGEEREVVARLTKAILISPPKVETNESSLSKRMFRIARTLRFRMQGGASQSTDTSCETCSICEAAIPVESIHWARCSNGHIFTRCGMTLIAIQAPHMSKYCCVCNRQYLHGYNLRSLELGTEHVDEATDSFLVDGGGAASTNSQPALAELLFSAIDECVYCGGKFVA